MTKFLLLICLCILSLLAPAFGQKATLENLQQFFKYTFDTDHSGFATIEEFVSYFRFMQPEHNVTIETIRNVFEMFDGDSDHKVTIAELVMVSKVKLIKYRPGHKQIHIGMTGVDGEVQVTWVSNPEHYQMPVVQFGHFPTQLSSKVYAVISTYNVGHVGFHGKIYRAILRGLDPMKRYYYKVGDERSQTFSEIKFFQSPPNKGTTLPEINIAVFGDMGTYAPMGSTVIRQIARDQLVKPFSFVFLTGDIAYAGMNSEKVGEIEPIWDLFGELTESFAAYTYFMPGVGNHEKYYNYSSYHARYDLPKIYHGQTNLWFSFDYGQVHMAHFSSEHPYEKGSEQYNFLRQDLEKARANPNTKWIIVGVHRTFYCSDVDGFSPMRPLATVLEDLMNEFKVDIVQTGHEHCYERTWPVYKGQAEKNGHTETHFKSPTRPIYVVQGTAGALIKEKWVAPTPQWSIKRLLRYGYGRIQITGNILKYQFVSQLNGKILDEWFIEK